MTMFRVGPAGIPGSLKTDMNTVLNKKFGTTGQDYPPADWPADVNLLGPLPIIISNKAPIVSFNDGADDVPVEQGTFYVVPSQAGTGTPSPSNPRAISGYTGMTITHAKKNLIDDSKRFQANKTLVINQTDNTSFATFLKAGTYTISYSTTATTCYIYRREENDSGNTNMGKSTSATFTIAEDGHFRFWLYGDDALSENISNFQLEAGSSATTYTPYVTPETLPVSWSDEAGTVYGGELNVTTGVLTVTYASETYNGDESWSAYASGNGYARTVTGMPSGTFYNDAMVMCDIFAKQPDNSNLGVRVGVANANIYVVQANTLDGVSDATTFRTWLSTHNMTFTYKLATPVTYQLDPHAINTFYGANNFYCDTGDSQLNYRADISLYINNH